MIFGPQVSCVIRRPRLLLLHSLAYAGQIFMKSCLRLVYTWIPTSDVVYKYPAKALYRVQGDIKKYIATFPLFSVLGVSSKIFCGCDDRDDAKNTVVG